MTCFPARVSAVLPLLLLPALLLADEPPSNTIPIFADRPSFDDIDLDLFCLLSWMYFDVLQCGDEAASAVHAKLIAPADSTGMLLSIAPAPIQKWGHWPNDWIARIPEHGIHTDSAYAHPLWYGVTYQELFCDRDTFVESFSAEEFQEMLLDSALVMADLFGDEPSVWFYNTFDEAPARQWKGMSSDSIWTGSGNVFSQYDDYIPNLFTQDMDSVYRPAFDSTLYLPTLQLVDPMGTFSWLKHEVEEADSNHTVACVFSLFHTIEDWAGMNNMTHEIPGTFSDQATAVRSYLHMGYLPYSDPLPIDTLDNFPPFLMVDVYPFRQVGISYQQAESYTPQLGDSLNTWLLDHFEEGLDSTYIPAMRIALAEERDIPVFAWVQAIGRMGGDEMWSVDSLTLNYSSYPYRIPTPAELLMNCNLNLLRGARGILPYCMVTYGDPETYIDAGYLDENNLPFDAPYEGWVYRDRHRSDFDVIPPDSFPPFIDSPYDFDPLYELPDRPIMVPGSQRNREDYLLWKFEPYARIWNSLRTTNARISRVAPELAGLSWWEDFEDIGSIAYDGTLPLLFVSPEMRFFGDSSWSTGYLFYVNRHCRSNHNPFEIVVEEADLPNGVACGDRALDHGRRVILEGTESPRGTFTFHDTLDAGEARLIQLFDPGEGLDADIRITRPDIRTINPVTDEPAVLSRQAAGSTVEIAARFYNMGTEGAGSVQAVILDLTDGVQPDPDTVLLDFTGLSMESGHCGVCDSDDAIFSWETDSTDIGVHLLEVRALPLDGEPDTTDNRARLLVVIEPRDYSSTVLEDPWDMTEATTSPPAWHTTDIDTLLGWSMDGTLTDSVSGMFEGSLPDPSRANRLVLHVRSGSSYDIDTGLYDQLSLAGIADRSLDVILGWTDEYHASHTVDTGLNLTATWSELGPVDLYGLSHDWASEDATKLWLEFQSGSPLATEVRLGWIRLTE